jgi:hypothetical protein
MFRLVDGHEKELGYVSLNEITSIRGPMGLAIERDLFWSPKKLGDNHHDQTECRSIPQCR